MPAQPYEMGSEFFGAMYPVYVRGLAYLKARQGEPAAAEFSKILSHRGIAKNSPLAALAQLQLARAQAMQWRQAGGASVVPGFPVLVEAGGRGVDPPQASAGGVSEAQRLTNATGRK